jgi:hypothetical protein
LPLLVLLAGEHLNFRGGRAVAVILVFTGLAYVALFPLPVIYASWFGWLRTLAGSSGATMWLGFGIILTAGLVLGQIHKLPRTIYPTGSALTLIGLFYLSISSSFQEPLFNDRLKERYSVVHDTFSYLSSNFESNSYRFWIDRNFIDAAALASTQLWQSRLWIKESFPKLVDPIVPRQTIIVPNPRGSAAVSKNQIDETLAHYHLEAKDYRVTTIAGADEIGFDLSMFKIVPRQFDPQSPPAGITDPPMIAGYEYFGARRYSDYLYSSSGHNYVGTELIQPTQSGPLFQPTPTNNSVYSDYRLISKPTKRRRLGLVIYMPLAGSTQITLEDNFARNFATIEVFEEGRSFHIVLVPDDANLYRLRFSSTGLQPTRLPSNINIYAVLPE